MNFEFRCNSLVIRCKSRNTKTANKIIKMLPIKSSINTWGDEIYFEIKKSSIELEKDSKDVFNLGEIAFWTQGSSVAIGFGPTPASKGSEIRLVTKCNTWADAIDKNDLIKLKTLRDGEKIEIFLS
jgi:uncharacterized protein